MGVQMYEEKFMLFPQGKRKALTFSYDDGVEADKRLLDVFKKYGLKGAFNLNSLLFDKREWHGRMDEQSVYETFKSGCEIAMHGARHIFLDKVPFAEAVGEIAENRRYLENKFKRTVRGFAYAYGAYNDGIVNFLKQYGVAYARTTESSQSFAVPDDWLRLKPTCHHNGIGEFAERFIKTSPAEQKKNREPYLFYIWGHSFEFDDNGNWELIEKFAKEVAFKDDIWYATGIEIYDYVKAYESLIFSADGERAFNPSYMPVFLEIRGKAYRIDGGKELVFDR